MTQQYFVSFESRNPQLTKIVLPGSEKYDFETVIGISKNFNSDIEVINLALTMADYFKNHQVDKKYNARFFPDLPKEFTFGDPLIDEYDSREEFIENSFMLKRIDVVIDDEREAQISACLKASDNKLVDMLKEVDYHFTKQNVSSKIVLN